jgi:glycerol-3-phosphate O-acyltransferase
LLRTELFLSWPQQEVAVRFERLIDWFVAHGLAVRDENFLHAPSAQEPASVLLHALARCVRQPLERYFITIETLKQFGSARLSSRELEDVCFLLAQRVAFLHEAAAPEFFDRTAFRTIIHTLLAEKLVFAHNGLLEFGPTLERASADNRWLLSTDTRLAIAHATSVDLKSLLKA